MTDPGDRQEALVFVVRGLMWAIEHLDATDAQRDQMTLHAQTCLRDLGVGPEELELAIYDASPGRTR